MRNKYQNTIFGQLSRHAIRFDGEGGGGSSTPTTTSTTTPTTVQPPASDPAKPDPDGTETKPFKTFASEDDFKKEMDSRITQALKTHEETLKGKLTPEIRAQLEKEANMTAEQKFQAQLDDLNNQKAQLAKEKVRIKVESLFASKGISETDRQPMLDSIVDDNEEESLKRGQALIAAIDSATNEKIKAAMKDVKVPNGEVTPPKGKSTSQSIAENLGKENSARLEATKKVFEAYR